MNDLNGNKILVRGINGRVIAGVCVGFSNYFGVDVSLIRVIVAIASVLTGGTGILAYLVAWMIIPEEGQKTSVAGDFFSKSQRV